MPAPILFWYDFASTYSYPATMRIERLAAARGIAVEWRPFLLGPIFQRQGWTDSPFNLYPAKGRYMWRDLARICEREQIPLRQPSAFPRLSVLAARVALAAAEEGWCAALSRAVYRANFAEDRDIASREVMGAIIAETGHAPEPVLNRAVSDEIKARLRALTDEAMASGIFGAPSFTVAGELFWGNDRLEEALLWAEWRV